MVDPQVFLLGMLVMGCAVIGLTFLRFWKQTRDRLFIYFAAGFWLLGMNWLALAFTNRDEMQTALYGVRLFAFGVIIVGIWQKNRQSHHSPDEGC